VTALVVALVVGLAVGFVIGGMRFVVAYTLAKV
jgi:hypothetical protein